MYNDIVLHSPEYDASALPVEKLLNSMSRGNNHYGKKAKIKKTGEIISLLNDQWCWGYNDEGKYTTVDGVRYESDLTPLGSLVIPLNEIEIIEGK